MPLEKIAAAREAVAVQGEVTLVDPAYWLQHRAELLDALKLAARPALLDQRESAARPGGVGVAESGQIERLTLSVEEAADMLGISRALAYEAVRRGEIPHIRIGKRILVPKTALERLLAAAGGGA